MPVALISTSTSPAFGPSRSSSTISSGFLASKATAARVFMVDSSIHCSTGSVVLLDTCATGFRLLGGVGLVFMSGRTATRNGIVGAGTQIHIDIVDVAHHVHIGCERRHDLVVGDVHI